MWLLGFRSDFPNFTNREVDCLGGGVERWRWFCRSSFHRRAEVPTEIVHVQGEELNERQSDFLAVGEDEDEEGLTLTLVRTLRLT